MTARERCGQNAVMPRPSPIPPEKIARVLAAADVSPRTLRRYIAGASLLGSTLRRLDAALRAEALEGVIATRAARVGGQGQGAAA